MPSRTRSVCAATAVRTVSGSSQCPSGPVGWRPPSTPPVSGSAVRLEVLAEHHVVGDDDPVDAGQVGGPGQVEDVVPGAGILGRVGGQRDREPRRRHARGNR